MNVLCFIFCFVVLFSLFFFWDYIDMAGLEICYVDQAGLKHTEICLCLPNAGIKGMCHHVQIFKNILLIILKFGFWFFVLLYCCFETGSHVSCPWTCYVAEDDLELVILPPPPSKCWDYRLVPHWVLCGTGDWTQGFMHANQILYQLNYIPSLVINLSFHR